MHTLNNLPLTPEEYHQPEQLRLAVARHLQLPPDNIAHLQILRRSLDCRRHIRYQTTLQVWLQGEPLPAPTPAPAYQQVTHRTPIIIVGAGPAGLFAALQCLQNGLKPIIIERGQPVEKRQKDIAHMARTGTINAHSNWCFGEGGAGTYSDGKLYTRSTKRGNVQTVLQQLVAHGANPEILIDAHGHIGTDKLSTIIARIRHTITTHGGEYHFGTQVTDLLLHHGQVCGVADSHGTHYEGAAVLLATGHSARDIYTLFHNHQWQLQAKPFAMGVRVEHPQPLIDDIQYHHTPRGPYLPPATYSLTSQVKGHGVFSFCMCPGGVIVPAATAPGEQVVNGMSNSHRSSPFANSGIAVTVSPHDLPPAYAQDDPLALLHFQQHVEQRMYQVSNSIAAPCQRLTDFCNARLSPHPQPGSYLGQTISAPLHTLLPPFIVSSLQQGFRLFDQKMHGFYTREAHLLAVESRTSSPVRIPRTDDYQHPQLSRLYPCGEGAGYAGGIVSSALDGINCINHITKQLAQ